MKTSALRRYLATVTAAILLAALPRAVTGATFSDDFSSGLRPAWWSVSQTTAGFYAADATQGNVQLAKTATPNPGGLQNVALVLNLSALAGTDTGDFETQVDFTDAVVPGPGLDQVELHTHFKDGSYFFTVYDRSGGLNVHVWNGSLHGTTPVSGDAGTFRIARAGSTLTGYYNGSPVYSQINNSPLVGVSFVLQNNLGSDDMTSVTFDNFVLTAASLLPRLNISRLTGTEVGITWGTNSVGYVLEYAAQLKTPTWAGVTNVPVLVNDHYVVPFEASVTPRFFRLHQP